MTPRPVLPPRDAQILDLLVQVAAIAHRRGLGSKRDIARIANTYLGRGANPRAEAAERDNRALRAELDEIRAREKRRPKPAVVTVEGKPIAYLGRREVQVLTAASEGTSRPEIAERLGISAHNVSNTLYRAARHIGAESAEQAIAIVAAGRVEIQERSAPVTRRDGMAA